jgi:plasmid stabilization system protein ParE
MAPRAWTDKDERQYDKIKESLKRDGRSTERAKEIAARTVNQTRRKQGRTLNKTPSGTGNPSKALSDRTVQELRNLAGERRVKGRSGMKKAELVRALQRA